MIDWISNPYMIGLVSFIFALGIPLLIYEWLIRPNPVVASWFGMERVSPKETVTTDTLTGTREHR